MSYENSDRHRVAWSREKKEANNTMKGTKATFGMPKILYPCRFFYPPIVSILAIYNGVKYFVLL